MRINSPYITGSAIITGNLCVQGTITGTITGVASTASYAETLDGLDSTQFVQTGSFNSYTSSASSSLGSLSGSVATTTLNLSSSIGSLSGSAATTTSGLSSSIGDLSSSVATTTFNLSSSIGGLSSSVATTTSGLGGRITTIEGRYATTGSNIFVGSQTITGSLYITTDLIVQGSSSLQNITASAVSIGTNTVILNTDTPAVRFAGVSVQDSGSNAGVTGSIFWDGLCNRWVYSNPSNVGYSGGLLISGPRNTATLGDEVGTTSCALMMGQGGDHITSSAIFHYGNATCFYGTSFISGSGDACFSGQVCASLFMGGIVNGTTACFSGLVCSNGNVLIGGSGVSCYLPKFTSTNTIGNSLVFDDGINVGIGTNIPTSKLTVLGDAIRYAPVSLASGNAVLVIKDDGSNGTLDIASEIIGNANVASNPITFRVSNVSVGRFEALRIDNTGNLGLGVIPNAWSGYVGFQIGNQGSIGATSTVINFSQNVYYGASGNSYIENGKAAMYQMNNGVHGWRIAGTGTAGCAITFCQAMTLDECGRLGVGVTDLGPDGISLPANFNYTWSEGSGNAYATLFRQRNSAATVVASGYKRSNTGSFASSYGTSMARAAIAVGYNNGSIALFSDTANNVANGTDINPTERMTILSTGNVGINTNAPGNLLTVVQSTSGNIAYFGQSPSNASSLNALIQLQSGTIPQSGGDTTGQAGLVFTHSYGTGGVNGSACGGYIKSIRSDVFGVTSQACTALVFATSTSNVECERMRISSNGTVLIGTTCNCWNTTFKTIQIGNTSINNINNQSQLVNNIYYDGIAYKHLTNAGSNRFIMTTSGYFQFETAVSANVGCAAALTTMLSITNTGNVLPGCNGTQDLGSSSLRWCTVYTSDLSLNNGIGNYTIVEGESDLFIYNNNSCKVYKFLLQEVCKECAPAKRSI